MMFTFNASVSHDKGTSQLIFVFCDNTFVKYKMIPQTALFWNFSLIVLFSFIACKDTKTYFPVENGDPSGSNAASPVLLMLSEMMNKNAKSANLKELQKQMEADRTHIQKIPRRNQEKLDLEEKKKELEEKERELEGNFVLSPDINKYSYKNARQEPSITYTVDSVCQLATCYKDGKPFINIHSYCYNGIKDLQTACEERFFSARYRRAEKENAAPAVQLTPNVQAQKDTCTPGNTWKEDCNTCYCIPEKQIPSCTRMKCPPKEAELTASSPSSIKSKRDLFMFHKPLLTEDSDEPSLPNPNSLNHECVPKTTWQEDCNTCYCTQDGLGKTCSANMCAEESSAVTAPVPCMPGTSWKQDCNDCYCTFVGAASCSLVSC